MGTISLVSHVIEESCEQIEDSPGHSCKVEQLCIQEAAHKPDECPPPALLCWGELWAQSQGNGQCVCDWVDLHVDRQAIEESCPR